MSTLLNKLYQSRKIILEMLELRGYSIEQYTNFTINEIDLMTKNASKKLEATNNTSVEPLSAKLAIPVSC